MSDYLKEQQRKFEDYAERYRQETNEVFRELGRQLILVATVFLSISAFVFNAPDLILKFSCGSRIILILSWILLGLSIIFGIIQFFVDYNYFRKWTQAKFEVVEKIISGTATENNLNKVAEEVQKDIPNESSTIFVWLQVFSLVISIILLIITMISLLFR